MEGCILEEMRIMFGFGKIWAWRKLCKYKDTKVKAKEIVWKAKVSKDVYDKVVQLQHLSLDLHSDSHMLGEQGRIKGELMYYFSILLFYSHAVIQWMM